MTDSLLRSSFKILGILALLMWIFLGVVVLLDLLDIDWMSRVSARARAFWNPQVTHGRIIPKRNDILRSIRDSLHK